MKIALGQINPTVGDFAGNTALIRDAWRQAAAAQADLLVLPELALTGYPAKDLLERQTFLSACEAALRDLVALVKGQSTGLLVGAPMAARTATGRPLSNAAVLIDGNGVTSVHEKSLLPSYDVFDEDRYFEPAREVTVAIFKGRRMGVTICEDAWNDATFWPHRRYLRDPVDLVVAQGAEIIINIAASPFSLKKRSARPLMLAAAARRHQRPLVFVNQVGGQDDLVFDGSSLVLDKDGAIVARAAEHAADLLIADVDLDSGEAHGESRPWTDDTGAVLNALTLGTRDYLRRCHFHGAFVGLSGGIDSALVAAVAARALGPAHVQAVAMPSRFSSEGSLTDARALARALGIGWREIPIEPAFAAYMHMMAPAFAGRAADVAEENLQARVRGTVLMALSNKLGGLVLTTGNKSEVATGYCTLYGDMAGGLAVISDVFKTLVYKLCHRINADAVAQTGGPLIPAAILTKPPSAELRPNQRDDDSLPAYDVLDPILEAHIEGGLDAAALKAAGFAPTTVDQVMRLVRVSEYKRKQLPPGLKISEKAFGTGRRMPIAAV